MKRELVLGCGFKKNFSINPNQTWECQSTIDINPDAKPDILMDLSDITKKLPFNDNTFEEIHAYEILEHIGQQGDYKLFFKQFEEYWRVLKPYGTMFITVPKHDELWAWGDPGHTRIINDGTLVFLDQEEYKKQIGITSMTDYRRIYKGNFVLMEIIDMDLSKAYILKAIK